ncbi:MAG: CoA pyrophosphatase [Solibacillus sp.]
MFKEQLKGKLAKGQPLFIGEDEAFRSAVLIPLVQVDGAWHVLFEVRAFNMRKQPGDISFPGGKIDQADASPCHAALRETFEELGVEQETVQLLGELSPYVVSPNFVVYPFVGVIDMEQLKNINKDEVDEVFTVPLEWLLECTPYVHMISVDPQPSEDFPFEKIMNGEKYQWRGRQMEEWFYEYGDYTIWGLTARILKYFLSRIQ